MFETVKTDVFTRSIFGHEASGNRFYNDFQLDSGVVLGAKCVHIVLFESPRWPTLASFSKVNFQAGFLAWKGREIEVGVKGRRQKRSQQREGEASPPSFEWISSTV